MFKVIMIRNESSNHIIIRKDMFSFAEAQAFARDEAERMRNEWDFHIIDCGAEWFISDANMRSVGRMTIA